MKSMYSLDDHQYRELQPYRSNKTLPSSASSSSSSSSSSTHNEESEPYGKIDDDGDGDSIPLYRVNIYYILTYIFPII